jgi:hypothetical protein
MEKTTPIRAFMKTQTKDQLIDIIIHLQKVRDTLLGEEE